jgi:D-alanine-D-alanine ligase
MTPKGDIYVIEVNPLPGLTPGYSDLCLIAQAAGIEYRTLIGEILEGGLKRLREKRREAKSEAKLEAKVEGKLEGKVEAKADPKSGEIRAASNGNAAANGNGGANGGASATPGANGGASTPPPSAGGEASAAADMPTPLPTPEG